MADGTNLATYYVQIVPTTKDIGSNLRDAIGGEADNAGSSFANKFADTFKKVIVGLGIGKVVTEALNLGGALQQSIGGIETLYGEVDDIAIESTNKLASNISNAAGKAYRDMGVTLYDQVDSVASSATNKLMSYANEAYKTVGVSANTYMEQVIGFSASLKQALGGDMNAVADVANMAMIDMADNANKMGTDIASIQTAYQGFAKQNYTMLDNLKLGYGGTKTEMERLLKDAEKISGIEYDIDNLSDVYNAIHVIQEDLGIVGATANEAQTTFTGSMAAMKASAENVLANLTLGEDIKGPLNALCETTMTFLTGNLIPMVVEIIKGLPSAIFTTISTLVPQLLQAGTELITNFTAGIKESMPEVVQQALVMILDFVTMLRENVTQFIDAGIEMIMALVDGLVESLPDLIAYVPEIVIQIADTINDNMPKILKMGWDIIVTLIKGIIDNIPNLIANAGKIIEAIWKTITAINWLDLGSKVLKGIINGLKNGISSLVSGVKDLAKNAWEGFKNAHNWSDLGTNLIEGIKSGVKNAATKLKDSVVNAAKNALDSVKNFLGIHSPSTVFRDMIGKNMALGIGVGFEDYLPTDDMVKNVEDITKSTVGAMDNGFIASAYDANGLGAFGSTTQTNTTNYGGVSINVYARANENINELADRISEIFANDVLRKKAVAL